MRCAWCSSPFAGAIFLETSVLMRSSLRVNAKDGNVARSVAQTMDRSAARLVGPMCILLLLVHVVLLASGCADMNSDDRAVFYHGWLDPQHADPLIK